MKILQKLFLSLIILLSILKPTLTQQWYQHGHPHFINEHDFQRLVVNPQTRNNGVTILKFFTPWCRYCKYLKEIIDELKAKDAWSITIYEVNCDQINHHFCGKMGVHSFPKMKVFQNGQLMENMDGFYPYQIVRELFLKFNRTQPVHEATHTPQISHEETPHHQEKPEKPDQPQFIEAQAVIPVADNLAKQPHQQPKPQQKQHQQPKPQQKVDVPLHHAQEKQKKEQKHKNKQKQHKRDEQPKTPQPPKIQQPVHPQPPKPELKKHANSVPTKVQQSNPQQQQSHQPQKNPNNNNMKKTQQMIEEQENIAIVDQDRKQIEKEKKIVEQVQNGNIDTIDLTKILPGEQHIQYGKYIMYAICIIVGGYYFVHIMKADPTNEPAKPHVSDSKIPSQKKSSIPSKISIEDSQLREELHFEHPNEEQINFNSVQVRDQDL